MARTPDSKGRIDNATRRSDTDAQEGHFCNVDTSNATVQSELTRIGVPVPTDHRLLEGIYLEPRGVDVNGIPINALVELGGEQGQTQGQIVVPYSAISDARGAYFSGPS